MNFPIHDYPSDYWRFTPEDFRFLLKTFETYEVEFDGDPAFPEGVYGFGIKGYRKGFPGSFVERVRSLKKRFDFPHWEASFVLFFLSACGILIDHVPLPFPVNRLTLW